ncbi:MAG: hypothetical protein MZW92_79075 [Comamonadaceae bacterium]|nr:hypothetical protein [Comamonadaceae bacterium]
MLRRRRARCSAAACGRAATQALIDGVIVNGSAHGWSAGSRRCSRLLQTGLHLPLRVRDDASASSCC